MEKSFCIWIKRNSIEQKNVVACETHGNSIRKLDISYGMFTVKWQTNCLLIVVLQPSNLIPIGQQPATNNPQIYIYVQCVHIFDLLVKSFEITQSNTETPCLDGVLVWHGAPPNNIIYTHINKSVKVFLKSLRLLLCT